MKSVTNFLSTIVIMMLVLFSFELSAQDVWSTGGNNADSTDFIGTKNAQPLLIKTDSVDRIIVGVNDTIQFAGAAVFDSVIIPNGFMSADSIQARVIQSEDGVAGELTIPSMLKDYL